LYHHPLTKHPNVTSVANSSRERNGKARKGMQPNAGVGKSYTIIVDLSPGFLDCFVAALLAKTARGDAVFARVPAIEAIQS